MKNDNPKPHDAFMKGLLSDTGRARTFLLTMLPKELSDQLDLNSLQPEDRSYVRDDLKEFFSDALFKVRLNGDQQEALLVSILLEHKSYPDNLVALQLLTYITEGYRVQAGLDSTSRAHTESLPKENRVLYPILPLLFYHGAKKWTYKPLHTLFGKGYASLFKYVPSFDIVFFNLRALSDADIAILEEAWLRAALLTQKYSHHPRALIERFIQIFEAINEEVEGNFFIQFIRYFMNLVPLSEGEFQQLWQGLPHNENTGSMNWLDEKLETAFLRGIEEGIEQGIETGIERGFEKGQINEKKVVIRRGIEQGIPLSWLVALTGYSEEEVQRIIQEK